MKTSRGGLTGRLAGDVVDDTRDAFDLVDDACRDLLQQVEVELERLRMALACMFPQFWFGDNRLTSQLIKSAVWTALRMTM